MADTESTQAETTITVNDDLNTAIETQVYLIDKFLEFQDKAPDFYTKFGEDLIRAATTAFQQIALIQKNITKQLKAEKPSVDVNSGESSN